MHLGKVEKLVTCMNCLQIIIVVKLVPSGRHEITCFFLVNTIKMMCFIHGYVGLPECRTVKSWQSRDCLLNVKEKGFHTVNGSEIRPTSWYGKYPIIIYRVLFRGDNQRSTVDGSEIRRSPVEVGSLSHNLQSFMHPRWCSISSINSIGPNATLLPSLKLAAVFFRK